MADGRIGPYEVLRKLGQGGMGVVYCAYQASLKRTIALKVLPREMESSPAAVRRFREEGVTAARLRHENIVAVYDAHVDSPPFYIAMEFLEGQSLAEFLRRQGRLSPEPAVRIAVQVCRALEHAHSHGIIHRDVKPGNIMVNGAGKVTLTDFGIARQRDRAQMTSAGAVLGSPNYMSPEQAQGEPADHRSDVYGCGAVLFAALTGSPPFEGEDTLAVMYQIVHHDPPSPRALSPDVTPELEAVVLKALSRRPEARYQSAAEMLDALRSCAGTGSVRAQQSQTAVDPFATIAEAVPSMPRPARVRVQRSRTRYGLAALLLVAGGSGLFAALHRPLGPAVPTPLAPAVTPAAGPKEPPRRPRLVAIPDLVGRTEQDAQEILSKLDLAWKVAGTAPHRALAEGLVASQDPKAGALVTRGGAVALVLSSGPPPPPKPVARSRSRRPRPRPSAKPPAEPARAPLPPKSPGDRLVPP